MQKRNQQHVVLQLRLSVGLIPPVSVLFAEEDRISPKWGISHSPDFLSLFLFYDPGITQQVAVRTIARLTQTPSA